MPRIRTNGVELHYEQAGDGPQTIVFAHGLLMSSRMFDHQVAALSDQYRCIAFDFRGQGQSSIPADGYDMDTLSQDVAGLIEGLAAAPCHFVGLSMGGFVGMRLAVRHPHLLRSLVLMDTAAGREPHWFRYHLLRLWARWFGLGSVAGRVMPILFGRKFLTDTDPARAALRESWRDRLKSNDRLAVTRASKGVIDRPGCEELLGDVHVPTLILVGADDTATPPEKSRFLHERIAGSQLVIIPDAGHSSAIEEPEVVNEALRRFLHGLASPGG
jgi:pimeloyl-ACP methyl ester carboxylesterase